MWRFAYKTLLEDRGRLLISVVGVAAALVLVLLLDGVFAGTSAQIVAYPTRTDADVWVMQRGVSNMHMATSVVPGDRVAAVRRVPGVAAATPILYVNNMVEAGGREWFSYIVGVPPGSTRGGPWRMVEGTPEPGPGQVVLPAAIAEQTGLRMGDTVQIMGQTLHIAGLSADTYSMVNSVTFVSYADLGRLMSAGSDVSYILVRARPGVAASTLARRIEDDVVGVHAMTRTAFTNSDRELALQMGADIIRIMTAVGFAVGVLIIGFTMYTATMRRRREYAVAKALGARNRSLLGAAAVQTALVTLLAFGLAIGLAYVLRPLIHVFVPEVAVLYPAASVVRLAIAAALIGAVATWLPARRVMRIDPALVFRE